MSIKQYTTPTIQLTIENGAEILAAADKVIVTVSDGSLDIDYEPVIEEDTLTITMTEADTARLSLGNMLVEATIKLGAQIIKTKTVKTKLVEAIRDKVVE